MYADTEPGQQITSLTWMNRRGLLCILAAVGLLFAVVESVASSKPSKAELAAITARGVLLAEYDTAAWQATDAVKAAHPVDGRMGATSGERRKRDG
jgi:hypothetical protein